MPDTTDVMTMMIPDVYTRIPTSLLFVFGLVEFESPRLFLQIFHPLELLDKVSRQLRLLMH